MFKYEFLKLLVTFKIMCLSLKLQFGLWKFYLNIILDVSIFKIIIIILLKLLNLIFNSKNSSWKFFLLFQF